MLEVHLVPEVPGCVRSGAVPGWLEVEAERGRRWRRATLFPSALVTDNRIASGTVGFQKRNPPPKAVRDSPPSRGGSWRILPPLSPESWIFGRFSVGTPLAEWLG